MNLYRYSTLKWIKVLNGMGAANFGGRYNPVGMPALYCCLNPSLPYLECLARNLSEEDWPQYYIMRFDFNDHGLDLRVFEEDEMPGLWGDLTHHRDVQEWGGAQLTDRDGIIAPSRVNRLDRTVILNPQRPDFISKITVESIDDLLIDDRIIKMII